MEFQICKDCSFFVSTDMEEITPKKGVKKPSSRARPKQLKIYYCTVLKRDITGIVKKCSAYRNVLPVSLQKNLLNEEVK